MAEEKYQYVLPKRMKEVMVRRGMTVSKLAARTGVSSKTIYGWLAGNPPRHLDDLFLVVRALNSTIEDLAFAQTNESPLETQSVLIGQWLRLCRERMRLSAGDVSERLDVPHRLLSSYENGEDIPIAILMSLAKIYQLDRAVLSAKIAALYER